MDAGVDIRAVPLVSWAEQAPTRGSVMADSRGYFRRLRLPTFNRNALSRMNPAASF
jgi:hypothetical protein